MRRTAPLILGAGPAGCAAAIALARHGAVPVLLDRDARASDALCGGFLSWRTVEQLSAIGIEPADLGASPVDQLTVFTRGAEASFDLPASAYGLSRATLDQAMRDQAVRLGANLEIDTARKIERTSVIGQRRAWLGDGLFLATGKHDVRGMARTKVNGDPALGLRLRLPPSPQRRVVLSGKIELHLFQRGYAGIVLQEDGRANLCLAARKSALAAAGGSPIRLLEAWAAESQPFADRLSTDWSNHPIEAVGAVPYGWSAKQTDEGVFRLGDQAAVIPSLAGEGISIALVSGEMAARSWLEHGKDGAQPFQSAFWNQTRGPLAAARMARRLAESPPAADAALALARRIPALLGLMMNISRIRPDASLAQAASSP